MKITTVLPLLLVVGAPTTALGLSNLRGGSRTLLSADTCDVKVSLSCKVYQKGVPDDEGLDCATFSFPVNKQGKITDINEYRNTTCSGTPETATFVYNGGDCRQTENARALGITCKDYNSSPPRHQQGQKSYIVVTGANDNKAVYHGAFVGVGDIFMAHDGGNLLKDGFTVRIYDNVSSQRKLLQKVSYSPSLCSNRAELNNRFGAVEVLGYTNDFEGYSKPGPGVYTKTTEISPRSTGDAYELKLDVTFSLAEGSVVESVSMEDAHVILGDDFDADLTGAVNDKVITPTTPVSTIVDADSLLLTDPQDYNAYVATTGSRNNGRAACVTLDSFQLPVGTQR